MWSEGERARERFIRKGRECAALTLPHLTPDVGSTRGDDLPQPYQGLGARGVNNLASRFVITQFPSEREFYRYDFDRASFVEAGGDVQGIADAELSLARRAREVQRALDTAGFRGVAYEAFLHLLVNGNFLLHFEADGRAKGYRLDQFQVRRDPDGGVARIVVREATPRRKLPPSVMATAAATTDPTRPQDDRDEVDVYTGIVRTGDDEWTFWQEVGPSWTSEKKTVSDADLPWLVLRMIPDANEDYGHSFVSLHLGPLRALEGLTQSMVEAAALSAHVVFFVDPSMPLAPDRIARAETGEFLSGNADLVQALTVDKLSDLTVPAQLLAQERERLEAAFLLRSAVQRDAERVTATEVQIVAQELDETLGGVFALLSNEFQAPLVRKLEAILVRRGILPPVPEELVRVKITTGIDALGRGRDGITLRRFLADAYQVFGEAAPQMVRGTEYLKRLAVSDGIDPEGLVRTEEEVQQINAQNQAQAIAEKAAGPAVTALAQGGAQ